jgi:cytochrome c-type biogenesis protein CcmE
MSNYLKLALGAGIMAATVAYVGYLGAAASWQYYLLVDECAAAAKEIDGGRVRVSGRVAAGSLEIAEDRRLAVFLLEGVNDKLPVRCAGVLPDNLAEGMEVVVEGSLLRDGRLEGDSVITRCASKYAPEGA